MLRFQPDGWLQGLLRPLIMADPVASIYFELPAPDLRPAALLLLLPLALWLGSLRRWPTGQAWRLPVALLLTLYLWTFVIGNGRYFLDVLWEEWKVAVEIDGIHHSLAQQIVGDAIRQNDLSLQGNVVLRVPLLGLRIAKDEFFAQIEEALTAAGCVIPGRHFR